MPAVSRAAGGECILLGAAFAFGWTPCIGPVLGGILTLTATSADVGRGVALLAVYSLGSVCRFLIAAAFTGFFLRHMRRIRKVSRPLQIGAGIIMVAMGVALITGYLSSVAFWLLEAFPASPPSDKPGPRVRCTARSARTIIAHVLQEHTARVRASCGRQDVRAGACLSRAYDSRFRARDLFGRGRLQIPRPRPFRRGRLRRAEHGRARPWSTESQLSQLSQLSHSIPSNPVENCVCRPIVRSAPVRATQAVTLVRIRLGGWGESQAVERPRSKSRSVQSSSRMREARARSSGSRGLLASILSDTSAAAAGLDARSRSSFCTPRTVYPSA